MNRVDENQLSSLERQFIRLWRILAKDQTEPVPEYGFYPRRQWRFDFAWPLASVAVEIEGGTHTRGRHTRGRGYAKDCEKYNAAAELGWTVLRYTGDQLNRNPHGVIEQIQRVLRQRLASD